MNKIILYAIVTLYSINVQCSETQPTSLAGSCAIGGVSGAGTAGGIFMKTNLLLPACFGGLAACLCITTTVYCCHEKDTKEPVSSVSPTIIATTPAVQALSSSQPKNFNTFTNTNK
jgi:hypothetical protein